jgi:hypothetical protein
VATAFDRRSMGRRTFACLVQENPEEAYIPKLIIL